MAPVAAKGVSVEQIALMSARCARSMSCRNAPINRGAVDGLSVFRSLIASSEMTTHFAPGCWSTSRLKRLRPACPALLVKKSFPLMPLVEHAHSHASLLQPYCEAIGPATVSIDARHEAVGYGSAKRDHRARCGRVQYVEIRQEIVGLAAREGVLPPVKAGSAPTSPAAIYMSCRPSTWPVERGAVCTGR